MSYAPALPTTLMTPWASRAEPEESVIDSTRQSGVRPRSASRTSRAVEQCVYRRRDPDRADNPACDAVTVTPRTLGTNADGRFDEPQYRNDRRAPLEVRGHRRGSARAASRRHARPADELRRRAAANTRKTVARFADGLAIARRHEVTSLDPWQTCRTARSQASPPHVLDGRASLAWCGDQAGFAMLKVRTDDRALDG